LETKRSLILALLIIGSVFLLELVGGIFSKSLALVSDAGHMLTDTMALLLALLATTFATLPATKQRTYGFYRLEILSALFNGSFLTIIAFYIFYQAYFRFLHPVEIQSALMLLIATIGLFANLGAAVILSKSSQQNLNVRGAFLHVLSDLLSSVGVIVGGVLIHFWGWYYADPILGIMIGILILRGAVKLVYESSHILLEAVPLGINLDEVAATIKEVRGVENLHDLHIWTITSGINAISAHLVIKDGEAHRASEILQEINKLLKEKYHITHATFQTECLSCPQGLICQIEPEKGEKHEHFH